MSTTCCTHLAALLRRVVTCWVLKNEPVRVPGRNIVARTWPNGHNIMQHPQIYKPLAPRWSIGHLQFSSTVLCPELVVQFGSISGLFAVVHVRLIFSSCFSAYHAFVYLEGSKRVPDWLRYHMIFLMYGRSTSTNVA